MYRSDISLTGRTWPRLPAVDLGLGKGLSLDVWQQANSRRNTWSSFGCTTTDNEITTAAVPASSVALLRSFAFRFNV
ncbi:hypothetical protein BJH93_07790 [Kocuria polaris]|nr:hypothetical protein [Kocuria polaris]